MRKRASGKAEIAHRAWGLMFDFIMRTASERMNVLRDYGLTPNDSRGLTGLDPVKGRTMRALAREWSCDASNATWIVDRLERLRLAKRLTSPTDGRVKLVVLTRHGVTVKRRLLASFHVPPAALFTLGWTELERLKDALEVLADAGTAKPSVTSRTQ